MKWMMGSLVRTPVLIITGILTLLVGASFAPVQAAMDGPLLDMAFTGEAARERLSGLSAEQRYLHFLGTVINDTLFPLAYGAFFAGLAGRFAPQQWRVWVMLPALLAVIADLAENTTQALALYGAADLLTLKSILTPLKFGLVGLSLLLAVGFVIFAVARRLSAAQRQR